MKTWVSILLVLFLNPVLAAGDAQPDTNKVLWKKECGACHAAFPPGLLVEENWQHLMESLADHFGSNAELNSRDANRILDYLKLNAGSGGQYFSRSSRITETPLYQRDHRVIAPKEWTNEKVKTRSNCAACHGPKVLGE